MMLLSVKTYAAFLWVLLTVESMNVSTPETRRFNVTDKQTTSWHPDTDDSVTETIDFIEETHSTVVLRPPAAHTTSSGLLHSSTAVTTATEGVAHSHSATITETVKSTEEQSASTYTNTSASAMVAASSPHPTSISNNEITSTLITTTTTTSDRSVQNFSSPPASPTTPKSPTSESIPGFDHTSLASETSTRLPATSQYISDETTSEPPDTTLSSSASQSTDPPNSNRTTVVHKPITSPPPRTTSHPPDITASTSASISNDPFNSTASNSTGTTAVLIPHQPKKSTPSTTTSTTASTTAAPCHVPKDPPRPEDKPCSTRGVVKPCLIAIAVLAGLATIFMVTTIVLCTKLSARKYKVRKPHQATEMMCISSLLPEPPSTRQRNRVPNGVLVFPGGADSDEDGGDNLTLSSFLPENDRYV